LEEVAKFLPPHSFKYFRHALLAVVDGQQFFPKYWVLKHCSDPLVLAEFLQLVLRNSEFLVRQVVGLDDGFILRRQVLLDYFNRPFSLAVILMYLVASNRAVGHTALAALVLLVIFAHHAFSGVSIHN
jgi:hypothetical protein